MNQRTLVINDLHLGCRRQGGTTPQSRKDLDEWMLDRFSHLLDIPHDRLIIMGDLCDGRNIPEHIMAEIIDRLGVNTDTVHIVLGNHDLGGVRDGVTMSSTEFIARTVGANLISTPQYLEGGIYIVPHMFSQEEHEGAIAGCPPDVLLLTHCNIDSPFAHGDHSLNLSKEEIQDLNLRGVKVLAAHEHAHRAYMDNVTVIGNQFPSSIADCLHGVSYACLIGGSEYQFTPIWEPKGSFLQCDHTDISVTGHRFVRVNGECNIMEYPAIVREIAELRKESDAFVISNNVQVRVSETETLSAEDVTNFNIIELLLERLGEEFREDIKSCI